MMTIRCVSVNYFSSGQSAFNGLNSPIPSPDLITTPSATVTFSYSGNQGNANKLENFSLTFTDLEGPLEYFPGEFYDLSIEAVAPPEPVPAN